MRMNSEIKNVTEDTTVSLFVRKNGVDQKVDIPPKESIVVDDFETKTIRVFKKKGFITMDTLTKKMDSIGNKLDGMIDSLHNTMDESIDPNNDEVMDKFHTTQSEEVVVVVEDEKKPTGPFKIDLDPNDPTAFEVIESEVKQYVENGYIKGAWSEEDEDFLRKYYPSKGRRYCANYLNRNESSVQKKINALGLKKKKKKK